MTELETKLKQHEIDKNRRFPLLDITDNREQICKISMATQDYMIELNPDMKKLKIWEAIPRIVIEFINASFTQLQKEDITKTGVTSAVIGDIMEIGLEYMETTDADKDGNITPRIKCRSEWKYENALLPYVDDIPIDMAKIMQDEKCEGLPVQFFENREQIEKISKLAAAVLRDPYGIMVMDSDWFLIPFTFMAFMRKAKEFLIEHKDDEGIGVNINFADLINLGITKEGGIEEGDPVDYILYITPQQIFKKDNAKDDGKTEK